jgi:hypothetical protein
MHLTAIIDSLRKGVSQQIRSDFSFTKDCSDLGPAESVGTAQVRASKRAQLVADYQR